jgi:hypothetical protein
MVERDAGALVTEDGIVADVTTFPTTARGARAIATSAATTPGLVVERGLVAIVGESAGDVVLEAVLVADVVDAGALAEVDEHAMTAAVTEDP